MNGDVKAKWVAALRSNEYKQGRVKLEHRGGFCCLGVLCALAERDGVAVTRDGGEILGGGLESQSAVRKWAELDTDVGGFVTIGGVYRPLTSHNDRGRTFAEIADAIEAQL